MSKFTLKYNGAYDVELLHRGVPMNGVSKLTMTVAAGELPVVTVEFVALGVLAELNDAQLKSMVGHLSLPEVYLLLDALQDHKRAILADA